MYGSLHIALKSLNQDVLCYCSVSTHALLHDQFLMIHLTSQHVLLFLSGGTDSKHYANLTHHGAMRHLPTSSSMSDIKRVHGTDERSSVEDFRKALCVYRMGLQLFGDLQGGIVWLVDVGGKLPQGVDGVQEVGASADSGNTGAKSLEL